MKKTKTEAEKKPESLSNYRGSKRTFDLVASQIRERFGEKEVSKYDPLRNCLSFKCWLSQGYRVKKGEKALKSVTFVEKKEIDGSIKKYIKSISLFYYRQVQKIE